MPARTPGATRRGTHDRAAHHPHLHRRAVRRVEHRLLPVEDLAATVDEMARTIAAASPDALRWSKATINALTFGNSVVRPDLLLARE